MPEKVDHWDHTCTQEIVCPACGYVHSDSYEYSPHDECGEAECERCSVTFLWSRYISVTYTSKEIPVEELVKQAKELGRKNYKQGNPFPEETPQYGAFKEGAASIQKHDT